MNIEDLKQIDKRYRIEKPRLFEIDDPDSKASDEQLEDVERSLGVRLPPSYRAFLREFGGGTYGFIVIDGEAQEAVFYWNTDGGESSTKFEDILEFIARYAYEPA